MSVLACRSMVGAGYASITIRMDFAGKLRVEVEVGSRLASTWLKGPAPHLAPSD